MICPPILRRSGGNESVNAEFGVALADDVEGVTTDTAVDPKL